MQPVAASFDANFCRNDTDCRVTGDTEGACVIRATQGNYCECSSDYPHPDASLPVCTPANATTIETAYSLYFPTPACRRYTQSVQVMLREIVSSVLGNVTETFWVCGSVNVVGVADVPIAKAAQVATGTMNLTEALNTAIAAKGDADLNLLGDATSATLSLGTACTMGNARLSMEDVHNRCQAVACADGFERRQSSAGLFVCLPPITTSPAPGAGSPALGPDTSDDDLSVGAKAGIGLALGIVTLVSLVVLGYVIYFTTKKDNTKEEEVNGKGSEPTDDVKETHEPEA
eukprot:TRINITY_DN1001_c0_g1_i2.p1 TRINITY_DN1001_c0_g1~~TRINITY_DN1001_c0_g1_i2.p1  ORF type:complete len:322 (+),score=106.54 TRINITY_DN1001_c0_g1_i2:103-966(+)